MNCHDYRCGNATPNSAYTKAQCALCWTALHSHAVATSLGRKPAEGVVPVQPVPHVRQYINVPQPSPDLVRRIELQLAVPEKPPCKYEGGIATECMTCSEHVSDQNHRRYCGHPDGERDFCTRNNFNSTDQRCWDCNDYTSPAAASPAAASPAAASPAPHAAHKTIRVSFKHGLGDASNFAHLIPLYIRRGYTVQVHPGHADHAPVFRAAGAEIVDAAGATPHMWREQAGNKNRGNLSAKPMPFIGDTAELWHEYAAVRLDFSGQVCDADRESTYRLLDGLPRPIVAIHTIGFSWQNGLGSLRNYPDEMAVQLIQSFLKSTPGSVVWLDRDHRVPRVEDPRIRYFHDYSPGQLYEAMRRVDAFAGIDSGPLNFVRFTDTPAVGIWVNHHPADFALPRPASRHVVASRHAERDRLAGKEWNTVVSPDDGPSPDVVVREILNTLGAA